MRGIKKLLKIPLEIHPYAGKDDYQDITYGAQIQTTCYGEGKIQVVISPTGKEVVSNITLYVDGSDVIGDNDMIHYDGKDYLIKGINKVKELNGDIALWVVYL